MGPTNSKQPENQKVIDNPVKENKKINENDINSNFLDLVKQERREKWNQYFNNPVININTMSELIQAFKNKNNDYIRKRCNEAEQLILNSYFLKHDNITKVNIKSLTYNCDEPQKDDIIKNILIVGITGQGKTTFINSYVNYLKKIHKYDLENRYTVIDNTYNNKLAKSDTQEVKSYKIRFQSENNQNYIFNLIDTPGLGDTQGFEQDQKIIKKIETYLTEELKDKQQVLNAVLIVSQSSTQYLSIDGTKSLTQMAMLSILKLFGKNMCDFSNHILTFSDFTTTNVNNFEDTQSIFHSLSFEQNQNRQKYISQQYYQFQNSVFSIDQFGYIEKLQFNKNINNFQSLSEFIIQSQGFTLDLTTEVINNRKDILEKLQIIKKELTKLINQRRELITSQAKITNFKTKVEDSKNHTINVKIPIFLIEDTGKDKQGQDIYSTNCLKCSQTCHTDCKMKTEKLSDCVQMIKQADGKYYCTQCKCQLEDHVNVNYKFKFQMQDKVEIIQDMKKEYDLYQKKFEEETNKYFKIEKQKQQITNQIQELLKQMKQCLEQLLSSALYKFDILDVQLKSYITRIYPEFKDELNEIIPDDVSKTDLFITQTINTQQTKNQLNVLKTEFLKETTKQFRRT